MKRENTRMLWFRSFALTASLLLLIGGLHLQQPPTAEAIIEGVVGSLFGGCAAAAIATRATAPAEQPPQVKPPTIFPGTPDNR